jgi:hypothetical protein
METVPAQVMADKIESHLEKIRKRRLGLGTSGLQHMAGTGA